MMKYVLKVGMLMVCVVTITAAFAAPYSRSDVERTTPVAKNIDEMVRYRPALRQNDVLFVEDLAGNFGPAIQPDPLWDSVLTALVGTGNFGWFTTLDPDSNGPSLAVMEQYQLVIWNCYDYWWSSPDPAALTSTDQNNISDLLFNGGKCWLIGQDLLYSGVPMSWMNTHFHLQSADEDYNAYEDSTHVHGLAEINCFSMTVIADYISNPLFSDDLTPDASAHAVLEDTDSSTIVGIFYPGPADWQSAFWSIDLRDSTFSYWPQVSDIVGGMLTAFGVTGVNEVPAENPVRTLQMNVSPDPFVRSTTISFEVPAAAHVTLTVYNNAGQRVASLFDGQMNAGSRSITWDRRDARGATVSSGVYFVRLTCGDATSSASIVVAR